MVQRKSNKALITRPADLASERKVIETYQNVIEYVQQLLEKETTFE
jgi:hypothetical protein